METKSNELLNKINHEKFDLLADYAQPYSIAVIGELLGVPEEDYEKFLYWSHAIVKMYDLKVSDENANEAVRQEGTSPQYMPIEFPAVPSADMVSALEAAATESKSTYHIGVVQSKDSFYGQHDPDSMPVSYELNQKWEAWVKGGVLCSEMEVSTLFVVGSYRRIRTGALLVVYGDQNRQEALSKEDYLDSVNKATKIILESSLKI